VARQRQGLRPPAPGQPAAVPTTSRRRPLYRVCRRQHTHPWWYSARDVGEPGRFDLPLPDGTCYWALSAATAILEVVTDPDQPDPPVITIAALEALNVWMAADVPAARGRLADTTVTSVPGLTTELATIVPYDLPWAWADGFHAAGRRGILYRARFGMGDAVALFGPAGAPDPAPAAVATHAPSHLAELPPAFLAGLGSVGTLDRLARAPAP
jgi:hypothetical protein